MVIKSDPVAPVEMGDSANPEVRDEEVIVDIKATVLMAYGCDKARAGVSERRPYRNWIECRHSAENVGAAVIAPYQRVFVEIVGRQNSSARK